MGQEIAGERPVARCVRCRSEFTYSQLIGAKSCPVCGDTGQPLSLEDDVTVAVNWHELRILSSWAEQWIQHLENSEPESARNSRGMLRGILKSLQGQYPRFGPLTPGVEAEELKKLPHKIN